MKVSASVRVLAVLAVLALLPGCGSSSPVSPDQNSVQYQTIDITVGTGLTAATGNIVTVFESFWLYSDTAADHKGALIDSGEQLAIQLGAGIYPKGLEQGITGMQIGGFRRIIVPPSLAYGSAGNASANIPANAALVFDVNLINVQ